MAENANYRPDIDGLRTVAVGLVLGYHFFPNHIKAGFIGVDVFFVISGYLISTIILGQMARGTWGYLHFYTRRINRIFPALVVVLGFNAMLGWYALVPNEFEQLGKHIAASAAFVANFALWGEAGYFDNAADTKPLLHLWSLAIEEQFYIVWPLVLAFALRRRFIWIVGVLAFGSLAYSIYLTLQNPTAAYYSPLSRFFELAIGGILAYWRLHGGDVGRPARHWWGLAGVVLLLSGALLITDASPFPGLYALLPTLGTAALIAAGPTAFPNRLLSFPPMIWIGLISYPLYLWHWSLLVWAKTLVMTSSLGAAQRIGLVGLSIVLASMTYILVERPIRRRNTGGIALILAAAMTVIGVTGLLFWTGSVPNRLDRPDLERVVRAVNDWEYPSRDMAVEKSFLDYTFYRKQGGSGDAVLFMGDSNMEQYAPRISFLIDGHPGSPSAIFATKGGCHFASPELASGQRDCAGKLSEIHRLTRLNEVKAIVIAQQWLNLRAMVTNPKAAASFERFLETIPAGKRKFIVLSIPTGDGFGPRDLLTGSRLGDLEYRPAEYRDGSKARQKLIQLNSLIRQIAARQGAIVIDPFETLCSGTSCRVTDVDGNPAYLDESHLNASFARKHATYIDQTIMETAGR